MIFKGIELSPTQPSRTDIAWAKPVKGGFALYLYFDGNWKPQVVMDSMGTDTPEDDKTADISDIPAIVTNTVQEILPDVIGDSVEEEVARQMAGHDESVNDTHNTGSGDDNDYPDVGGLFD